MEADAPFDAGVDAVTQPQAEPQPLPAGDPQPSTEQAQAPAPRVQVPIPPVVDVHDLDWVALRAAMDARAVRGRMRATVERMEALLDAADGGLMFDSERAHPQDRVIRIGSAHPARDLWVVGDLHGDLPVLEAALALIRSQPPAPDARPPGIIFLGDFFDDEGLGLEVVLRVFELILEMPQSVCVVAGNHDEALSYDGARFSSTVSPSDFADFLNANLAHEWIGRAGKLVVRLIAQAPRALMFPDGLLVAHGGFPLADLHPRLLETGDWNDPACLNDFTWSRAHPKARRKMPNRFSRGSQFGWEDFADFCTLSARLGHPVTHMVRGHDHADERFAIPAAYAAACPMLTTVALSRRLGREAFGPYERAPTVAHVLPGSLPQVHRLHIPADIVREVFPPPAVQDAAATEVA